MSLRDQLMQAGIASKKQYQQSRSKQKNKKIKNKNEDSDIDSIKKAIHEKQEQQKKRDLCLNKKKEEEKKKKEIENHIKQLIDAHHIKKTKGENFYYFNHHNKVKKLYVDKKQYHQIVQGVLAITTFMDEYWLIPSKIADKIIEIKAEHYLLVYNRPDTTQEHDKEEWYKDYKIPDDLMW